jgi:tetratricopeptide (TPR) repeat protein
MKQLIICALLLMAISPSQSQSFPDSVMARYNASKTSSEKGKILVRFVKQQMQGSVTEKMAVLLKQLNYFDEQKDEPGINYTNLGIGIISWRSGEYSAALKYIAPALQYFEKIKDSTGILRSLDAIGTALSNSQNFEQALRYWKKSLPLAKQYNDKQIYSVVLNNTADCFIRMLQPDSALPYVQEAVRICMEIKDTSNLSYAVGTLGETYLARKEHDLARPFLKQSVHYGNLLNDDFGVGYTLNTLSQSFFETTQYDSAIVYAQQAVVYGQPDYKNIVMNGYEWLYRSFEKTNQQDSVYKYFRLAMSTKDSLFTIEKNRSIQSLNFQEQIRQQDLEIEKIKAEQQRKQNIQYALLALGIISFIILFLLLSRSFITNTKLIEFFGVIALLIVFEFLNLLLHPFLERITHHSPLLMLLALVCIAALLVPLHHRVEKWATAKLVEKNKQIRLAAAKKTIEQLEKDQTN